MQTLLTGIRGRRVIIRRQPTGIGPFVWVGEFRDGRGVRAQVQPGATPGDVLYGLEQMGRTPEATGAGLGRGIAYGALLSLPLWAVFIVALHLAA